MFDKTYRNKAGKSFTEGRKFRINDFFDYYDTLTDEEWEAAIQMAAKKGVDISNIRPYLKMCCRNGHSTPTSFEEIREKLLQLHGFNEPMADTCTCMESIEDRRKNIEDFYTYLGVPVPDYWREIWMI